MKNAIPNEEEVFHAARAIASPEERAAYLAETCGEDGPLRSRVDALLQVFLTEPSSDGVASGAGAGSALFEQIAQSSESPVEEPVGAVIGRYKLLERLGEGGFGIVYMAEQQVPVRRKIALKLIKAGLDTKQVIARFEAERQALAMMNHENIAKVLDAGATDTGRPYFVMELVHGVPITAFCDENCLPPRERLDLFLKVCRAVQHAHTKGIIHRDIKPTNVLVTLHDGVPVPKVIDFGVAKATGQHPLTERTLFTQFAQMVGTPFYMSPEQAEMSGLDVDTRSDVYSLGVLLYELLTGTTPFDRERLHKAAHDEVRRIIREEEPPRPSMRISTMLGEKLATVSAGRKTEARRLGQIVRGELDWIVMKALEKERGRRYETANGFARDVERYLQNEPVAACPPSASYRLRKLAHRHRRTVLAAGLLVVALLGGIATTTRQAVRARQAERSALAAAERANAIRDLLQEMLESANPEQVKGADYTVRQLLDDTAARLGAQLDDQPDAEAAIRETIGRAYRRLALPDKAKPHFERALELHRGIDGHEVATARALLDIAWNLVGERRNADAEDRAREALEIYDRHGVSGRPLLHGLWTRQFILGQQRRYDEAVTIAQEALSRARESGDTDSPEAASITYQLALAKLQQFKYAEAEPIARRAVEMQRRIRGSDHPETAWALRGLGRALRGQRKFAEAEQVSREALATFRRLFGPQHHGSRATLDDLSMLFRDTGDVVALEAIARERFAAAGVQLDAAATQASTSGPAAQSTTTTAIAQPSLDRLHDDAQRLRESNQLEAAAELLRRRADLAKQSRPLNEALVADSQLDYAQVLTDLGRYEPAEALLLQLCVTASAVDAARALDDLKRKKPVLFWRDRFIQELMQG